LHTQTVVNGSPSAQFDPLAQTSSYATGYGPRVFGGPAVFCNKSDLLHRIFFFSLRSQYFAKFAVSSSRRLLSERCLYPEILAWFFLYSYVTKGMRLQSAVMAF